MQRPSPTRRFGRSHVWHRGVLAFVGALGLSACDEPPGRLAVGDGGTRTDGGGVGSDASTGLGRPDGGPLLPGADREVVLPLGAPSSVLEYTVAAAPAMLDVHLSIDTTGSFVEEIGAIETSLVRTVIPSIRAVVPNASFGLSYFQDFPGAPFGGADDRPFVLLQRITSDLERVGGAVSRLDEQIGNGGDVWESGYEAIYQVATGAGYSLGTQVIVPRFSGSAAAGGGVSGGAGFRDGALRVLVHATDAASHADVDYEASFPGTRSASEAANALVAAGIHLVGITNGGLARDQLTELAFATGAVMPPTNGLCLTGRDGTANAPIGGVCPLVFDVNANGGGLSVALTEAVTRLVTSVRYARARGEVDDDRLGFVEALVAASAVPPAGATAPSTEDSTPGDGFDDTFVSVAAGTQLTFQVRLRNTIFASRTYTQTFRVHVRIVADEVGVVDEWIRVIIPAAS